MDYSDFTAEDFARDPYFIQWVKQPDDASEQFWQGFPVQHPEKQKDIEWARAFVKAATSADMHLPTTGQGTKMWAAIEQTLQTETETAPVRPLLTRRIRQWSSVAATLLIFAGLGWWSLQKASLTSPVSYHEQAQSSDIPLVEKINQSGKLLTILLNDGSSVVLQPGSRLSYPARFKEHQREVYLSGEAFFEIAKNPQKPFLVNANELTTKVLGTSFNVRAYDNEKAVTVQVKSGKVAVSIKQAALPKEKNNPLEPETVVLAPNQQMVYNRQEVRMETLQVNPAETTDPSIRFEKFDFAETPVVQVFEVLQKAYGVRIEYDTKILAECLFTASLTDEPLHRKMEIICKAIGARYEIQDERIVVQSKGC